MKHISPFHQLLLISLMHTLSSNHCAICSFKLTYGSCALRRWPSPQHGMKGTRAGRNERPSHRLPVRQQHPFSLGPCRRAWPTGVQTTKRRRGDDEDRGDAWQRSEQREQRTDVSTPAPYFCPPTPHVYAKSLQKLSGFKKSDSDAPSSPSSSSTHLQTVAAECTRADSEVHVWTDCLPHPEICNRSSKILWAAKSSAVLLCCGREVQLQAGTLLQLVVDLDTLIITHKFLLSMGRRWSSKCPLLTAVPCFLMEDAASILPASFHPRFSLL